MTNILPVVHKAAFVGLATLVVLVAGLPVLLVGAGIVA